MVVTEGIEGTLPTTKIICSKNRHLPWEGTIGLWLENRQFIGQDNSQRLWFNEELSA